MIISKDDKNKIKDVLDQCRKVSYAFLFGSALKAMRPESDIDILVKADLTPQERSDLSVDLELILKRKVDIVLAQEAPCELVLKAFSAGVPLLVNNKENLKEDYLKNFYLYDEGTRPRELRRLRIKRMYSSGQ